ncbi:MAG: TonB-dependent receptor [Bacteroidota bacterium]
MINRSYDFGRLPSSVQNQDLLPNSDLKPEETNSFEIGAEMSFLSNLLSLNFNYYKVNTKNQIFQAPISEASGFNAELINAGEIENEGVEGLVTVNPLQGEFNWTMTLNYSRNRNRVVSLAEGVESLVLFEDERRTIEARPGDNLFVLYGLGLQRTENGSVIYQDGLPLLSSSAQRIGRVTPNWTSGISNQFSYKQFSLGVLIDYRNGGIVSSLTNALLYRAGNNTESLVGRDVGITGEGVVVGSDGSTSPNEENVSARAFYQSFYNRSNIETNAFDATYLKIREISLSVNMTEWIENKWIDNMRLTLFARNILAWTKSENLRHFDPEISLIDASNGRIIPGLESAQLPGTATFGFNLNIRIK